MNKSMFTALVGLVALLGGSVAWGDDMGSIAVEVKAGTLGGGAELNYALSSKFTVGVGFNSYTRSLTESAGDIDYAADLNLQTLALLANFHPFDGAFRITAGVMSNGNELKMKAKSTSTGTYDIGGTTYSAADLGTLKGKVDFNAIAPYLGLGWGKSPEKGFGLTFDIGVLFQGAPNVSLSASGGNPTLYSDPTFQANLKQEETNAEHDIKDFTAYPVVSLGLDYRF